MAGLQAADGSINVTVVDGTVFAGSTAADGSRNITVINTGETVTNDEVIDITQSLTGANDQSAIDVAITWNTTGTPTAIKLNVTDTASASASLLFDVQVGGASRFNIRKDGLMIAAGSIVAASGSAFSWGLSRARMLSPADGIITLFNNGATDFSRLQFGGTTASFPSLKRSGTEIQARLADDSGSANFLAAQITATGSLTGGVTTAITAGGSLNGLKISSTANFGVFVGSGAPTISAAQGSLYLRSDGSSTSTRAYINTDGGTTWTAITTAA